MIYYLLFVPPAQVTMASQICFHLSIHYQSPCKIHTSRRASSLPHTRKLRPNKITGKDSPTTSLSQSRTRRQLNFSILLLFLNGLCPKSSDATMEDRGMEVERYTDANEGFSLLRPSSWIKVEKAGATVLFEEEANKGSNNVGVVVSPVRLESLGQFGTAHFVAHKLIQAEKRKESTKDVELVGVSERSGTGGLQVYEFEYKVDSSRGGMKRIFSAAFVASKKLYLLNVSYSDKPENPLDSGTKKTLEKVLHSFDTVPIMMNATN